MSNSQGNATKKNGRGMHCKFNADKLCIPFIFFHFKFKCPTTKIDERKRFPHSFTYSGRQSIFFTFCRQQTKNISREIGIKWNWYFITKNIQHDIILSGKFICNIFFSAHVANVNFPPNYFGPNMSGSQSCIMVGYNPLGLMHIPRRHL